MIPNRYSLVLTISLIALGFGLVDACPRMECAGIISKCQLLDFCRCEVKLNYTCLRTCSHCLADQFHECCSCIDACPKEDENDKSLQSHVKLIENPNEDVYDLITTEEDRLGRYHVHRQSLNASSQLECTMVYLASCVDINKCESSCVSMGASGFRWFHIGCCACVGKYCVNFGFNEIRCRNCPEYQTFDTDLDI